MAREFDDASSQYLTVPLSVSLPFAFSAWVWMDDTSDHAFISIGQSAGTYYHALILYSAGLYAYTFGSAGGAGAITDTTPGTGQWFNVVGLWVAADDRRAFHSGGNKGTEATSNTVASPNQLRIGVTGDSTPYGYHDGKIAEAAVWDLSDWPGATDSDKADEFERVAVPALVKYAPSFFGLGLQAYWPLIRDEDQDRVGGYDLTPVNTPTIAVHPPVIYPALPFVGKYITDGIDYFRTVTDTIGVTDFILAARDLALSISDSIGITDTLSRVGTFVKGITDAVGITDSISTARDLALSIADSVGITDAISALVGIVVNLAETVGITDALSTTRDIVINIAEAVGITDLLTKIGIFFIRPDGDQAIGQWTDELGGTTNIYQSIDEVTPNDSDYIQSPFAPQTQSYTCTLSDALDPGIDIGHTLNYRYRKFPVTNQQVDLTVTFLQGAVELTSWDHLNVASGWVTANQLISSGIVANITDYTDLRLEFEANIV